jgi:hypothetical protein
MRAATEQATLGKVTAYEPRDIEMSHELISRAEFTEFETLSRSLKIQRHISPSQYLRVTHTLTKFLRHIKNDMWRTCLDQPEHIVEIT